MGTRSAFVLEGLVLETPQLGLWLVLSRSYIRAEYGIFRTEYGLTVWNTTAKDVTILVGFYL